MKQQLLLVDGNGYIFRAFYGVRAGLTNKKGFPTNAVFGFKNMLLQLLKKEDPSHCVVVFDAKGKNFRHEIYPQYKANRDKAPEDLGKQFDPIHRLVRALNLSIQILDGYEADDVIGSLVRKFEAEIPVKIISGDKDLTQLVTDKVLMYDSMKDFTYSSESITAKYGVTPEQIHYYLALMGDSSDNIPGAKGIGPKTAAALLQKYNNIDGIYANIDQIKGKNKEKLLTDKENVELSFKLTEIQCDIPLANKLDDFLVNQPNLEALTEFYREMDFRLDDFLGKRLLENPHIGEEVEEKSSLIDYSQYELVTEEKRLLEIKNVILQKKLFVLDLETTSLRAIEAEIVGISLAWDEGNPVYIPIGHTETASQIPIDKVLQILGPLFQQEEITMIGQNIKYDLLVLKNYDVVHHGSIEDTMILSYLLNAESHRHNLDELASIYLQHKMIAYKDVTGTGKKQIPFAHVPLATALNYSGEDADVTLRLFHLFRPKLGEKELIALYRDIEMPLCRVLLEMEHYGVKINREQLHTLSREFNKDLQILETKIYELAGEQFNINSPKQLGYILFEKLGITTNRKKTKSGGYSTDVSVLEALALTEPIAFYLMEYRKKAKLTNTYIDVLPTLLDPKTGRIHTSYNQTVVATGRLSSSNPNLQNIPVKGEDGRKIRQAFISEPGFKIMSADYSQIELRILAHLAQDSGLIAAFKNNLDIHRETAAAIYGTSNIAVSEEQRRAAKAINFGIIYGMGAFRLSREIGVTHSEAKAFIDRYFEQFPNIKQYIEETIAFAGKNGYVKTILRRRRAIPNILSQNHMVRTAAERAAVNTTIQGSAADLIKLAMIQVQQRIIKNKLDSRMVMQVHDELVFEVAEKEESVFLPMVKETMENVFDFSIPITVDIGMGNNWQEAH